MINKETALLIMLLTMMFSQNIFAVREPRATSVDSRIRIIAYNKDDVFKFTGHYGYHACIELSKTEKVIDVHMGDTTAWEVLPKENRICMKPIEEDATTNMTILTNKRSYYFELYAEEAQDIRDPELIFNVRFTYPNEEDVHNLKNYNQSSKEPDLSKPENYNFNYTITGHPEVSPIKIFDDGDFTYIQFRDRNADMPAVFAVDEDLRESIVNFRISSNNPNVIVVEQVFPKLSLRLGKKVVCIYNEAPRKY